MSTTTIPISPQQERLLTAIERRLDELDRAASPVVAGILAASDRLPPADRLAVKRRLHALALRMSTRTGPPHSAVTDNPFLSAKTMRRLSRSPLAPIPTGEPVLRTDLLVRLVIERLASIGPLPEAEVLDAIDRRAPGRGPEVITYAQQRGLIRRVQTDDGALLEAIGAPQSLAA